MHAVIRTVFNIANLLTYHNKLHNYGVTDVETRLTSLDLRMVTLSYAAATCYLGNPLRLLK